MQNITTFLRFIVLIYLNFLNVEINMEVYHKMSMYLILSCLIEAIGATFYTQDKKPLTLSSRCSESNECSVIPILYSKESLVPKARQNLVIAKKFTP